MLLVDDITLFPVKSILSLFREIYKAAVQEMAEEAESLRAEALQGLAGVQVPLLAGVVSLLLGDALQDRFAELTRQLVDRGKRVLAAER